MVRHLQNDAMCVVEDFGRSDILSRGILLVCTF
jgi:hypothetical protein